jgi:16S rRNA processing protein RimM
MEVINEKGELLGKVTYVFNTGANDIYEIKTLENKDIYLPAIKDVIKNVDVENKRMYVEVMQGLL